MELTVQFFIERYLDIIDTDQWFELMMHAYDELSNAETHSLINYLGAAGIDTEEISRGRSAALRYIIYRILEDFSPGNYGFTYFSNIHLKTFLGFNFYQMKNFIKNNANEWPDNVKIIEYANSNYDIVVE